jgi:hypothetical protein
MSGGDKVRKSLFGSSWFDSVTSPFSKSQGKAQAQERETEREEKVEGRVADSVGRGGRRRRHGFNR